MQTFENSGTNTDGWESISFQELEKLKRQLDEQCSIPIFIFEEKHETAGEVKLRAYQFNPSKFKFAFKKD